MTVVACPLSVLVDGRVRHGTVTVEFEPDEWMGGWYDPPDGTVVWVQPVQLVNLELARRGHGDG